MAPGGLLFDERGLLGLAFHPDYGNNGGFFVVYNASKDANGPAALDSQLHVGLSGDGI